MSWTEDVIFLLAGLVVVCATISFIRWARYVDWAHYFTTLALSLFAALKWVGSIVAILAAVLLLCANYVNAHSEADGGLLWIVADITLFLAFCGLLFSPFWFVSAVRAAMAGDSPGLETVRNQRIYDTGQFARTWQIDSALRGESGSGETQPEFDE